MPTKDIRNFIQVNEALITGGQPTEEQLRSVAADGFNAVINLATTNPRSPLPDEAGLVRSLGMTYHHIPVVWENPTEKDWLQFEKVMEQLTKQKTLVHCAMNYRVTAFYGLYAIKHLGWSEKQADEFRAPIWSGSNHPTWENFIRTMKDRIAEKGLAREHR